MSLDKKQQFKIRQFQWYQVETKVREIITDLFQNFNKKQMEETLKIIQIKRHLAEITQKLSDHDFLLSRQHSKKPAYLELQDQKIEQYRQFALEKQTQNQSKIHTLQSVIQIYEDRVKQINILQGKIDQEIVLRQQLLKNHMESVQKEIDQVTKKHLQHTEEIVQFKNTIKSNIGKFQSKIIVFDNRVRQLEDDRKHKTADINKLTQESKAHNEKINKLELKSIDLQERISDRQKDTKLSQKFMILVKQMDNNYNFITNFIEQYLPLYNQMQISDTLGSFITGRNRTKLCVYQEQKFAKLHNVILMNEKQGLTEMMNHYSHNIRRIIQRNKIYLINLQIERSLKYGGITYELRKNYVEDEEETQKKGVVPSVTVSEEQIAGIANQIIKKFETGFSLKLETEIGLTKTWMKELQEQFTMRQIELNKNESLYKAKLNDISIKSQLQQKYLNSQLITFKNKQNNLDNVCSSIKECIKDILNFGSVVNHIVIQDEIDRQSTALYAINSKNKGDYAQNKTLQLDSNCLNCQTKNIGIIQQAFKMACLIYNPSQINIDDKLYSRQEILQISTNILEKIKKRLSNTDSNGLPSPLSHFKTFTEMDKTTKTPNLNDSVEHKTFRKSTSGFKESISSRYNSKNKEFQTLLPVLGATRPDKKSNMSVFY